MQKKRLRKRAQKTRSRKHSIARMVTLSILVFRVPDEVPEFFPGPEFIKPSETVNAPSQKRF